ncbi:MAG TPA: dTDP-4-dehydrorhamnose 3,5-epimerase family protein [bacterium]|nr:dTDP-4-dehydrorhamnose 3,5-epimerase family protein [bacterium]
MIHDVVVQPLTQIADARGKIMHMLRSDSPLFRGFGEVYFSLTNPGAVKAWRRHRRIVQQLTVPIGTVRFCLHDTRADSATRGVTQVLEVGEAAYLLIQIPPGIWYGFQALGDRHALVANCTDLPYDAGEVERLDPFDATMPAPWSPG